MSKPTSEELVELQLAKSKSDDEVFHSAFDDLLEHKLMQLDPEWMKAMQRYYENSNMERWCA